VDDPPHAEELGTSGVAEARPRALTTPVVDEAAEKGLVLGVGVTEAEPHPGEIGDPLGVGAGLEHAERDGIVEGDRADPHGIEGRGAQGDEATVRVRDQVNRRGEALEEPVHDRHVVEEAKRRTGRPGRRAAGAEEIGNDGPRAALPDVLRRSTPLIAGHPAAVKEDDGLARALIVHVDAEIGEHA
jgi:hypothetical protein